MNKSKEILISLIKGEKVSRWDCAMLKTQIKAELTELQDKLQTELDLAEESR
jgi:hypothetical protein